MSEAIAEAEEVIAAMARRHAEAAEIVPDIVSVMCAAIDKRGDPLLPEAIARLRSSDITEAVWVLAMMEATYTLIGTTVMGGSADGRQLVWRSFASAVPAFVEGSVNLADIRKQGGLDDER